MSIETVEIDLPTGIKVIEIRQGPAGEGGGGAAVWGSIGGTLSSQTDLQTALNLKAPLASPALTGTPTAPTAATTTSTTQVATTAFVQQELAAGNATAKNVEVFCRNNTGATLTKGTIVYINGAIGNRPTITKAQANGDATSAQTIGFVKTDIAHNADGFVITSGDLENVNTGSLTAGQQLYLSPSVAGEWTTTKPSAPDHLVYVGIVVRVNNSVGVIYVAIQNGYELNELHDVAAQTPSAGQFLKRNSVNTLWVNSGIVSADITDATSSATLNTVVKRDSVGSAAFNNVQAAYVIGGDFTDGAAVSESGLELYKNGVISQLNQASVTETRNYTLPDASGTLMLGSQNLAGLVSPSTARTNLGAGTTGDALFTAATPAAARDELGLYEIASTSNTAAASGSGRVVTPLVLTLPAGFYRLEMSNYFTNGGTGASGLYELELSAANAGWAVNDRHGNVLAANIAGRLIPSSTTVAAFGTTQNQAGTDSVGAWWNLNLSSQTTIRVTIRNTAVSGTSTHLWGSLIAQKML